MAPPVALSSSFVMVKLHFPAITKTSCTHFGNKVNMEKQTLGKKRLQLQIFVLKGDTGDPWCEGNLAYSILNISYLRKKP